MPIAGERRGPQHGQAHAPHALAGPTARVWDPELSEIQREIEGRRALLRQFGQRLTRLGVQLQEKPEEVGREMGELAALFPSMTIEVSNLLRALRHVEDQRAERDRTFGRGEGSPVHGPREV